MGEFLDLRSAGGMRNLVVDDNEDPTEIRKLALEARGSRAEVADDGPSALKTAEIFKPDIALRDVGLPGLDGYELAQRSLSPALRKQGIDWRKARSKPSVTSTAGSEKVSCAAHRSSHGTEPVACLRATTIHRRRR